MVSVPGSRVSCKQSFLAKVDHWRHIKHASHPGNAPAESSIRERKTSHPQVTKRAAQRTVTARKIVTAQTSVTAHKVINAHKIDSAQRIIPARRTSTVQEAKRSTPQRTKPTPLPRSGLVQRPCSPGGESERDFKNRIASPLRCNILLHGGCLSDTQTSTWITSSIVDSCFALRPIIARRFSAAWSQAPGPNYCRFRRQQRD